MSEDSHRGEPKPLSELENNFVRFVKSDVLARHKVLESDARIEPAKFAIIYHLSPGWSILRSYYGISHDGNNFDEAATATFYNDSTADFRRKSQKESVFGREELHVEIPSREGKGKLNFQTLITQRGLKLMYDDNGQIDRVSFYYMGRKNSENQEVMLFEEDFKKLFDTEDSNQELEMKLPYYGIHPTPSSPHPNFRYTASYDPEKKVIHIRREDREQTVEDADGNLKPKVLDEIEIARYVDRAKIQDELYPEDLAEDPFGAPTSLDARSWLLKDYFQLFGVKWDRHGDIDMKKVDWKEEPKPQE